MNVSNENKYYLMLIIFGFICITILLSDFIISKLESYDLIEKNSNISYIFENLILFLSVTVLYIIIPLFFDLIKEKIYKKSQYLIISIGFFILGILFIIIPFIIDKMSIKEYIINIAFISVFFLYGFISIYKYKIYSNISY